MFHVTALGTNEIWGYQHVICNEYEAWPLVGYANEQHVRYSILQT